MSPTFGIVDIFAGAGGLGEGFSAFRNDLRERPFSVEVSIEKDVAAHATLRLRSFLRKFPDHKFPPEYYEFLNGKRTEPDWSQLYPVEWEAAEAEACLMEIGTNRTSSFLSKRASEIRRKYKDRTILIGGPPCQAYSLVGRSKNASIPRYRPHLDERNYLYTKYVKVLEKLEPAAFVMENVRGMLSSAVKGDMIFQKVLTDLQKAAGRGSYSLYALTPEEPKVGTLWEAEPQDYIVRMEDHGVPQARHRVIIIGLRADIVDSLPDGVLPRLRRRQQEVTVDDVIGNMPPLRSGLSSGDSPSEWYAAVREAIDLVSYEIGCVPRGYRGEFRKILKEYKAVLRSDDPPLDRSSNGSVGSQLSCPSELRTWLIDSKLRSLPNNETRGHIREDLARYFFAAAYGHVTGSSPRASEFPEPLAPNHKNWRDGSFDDRFRVQLESRPASTVTSHMSRDGHYYIHPDPSQCRSLTVREAARLQTFPDNYFFKGNMTQQYVQVGNAVPPFLAMQVAKNLYKVLIASKVGRKVATRTRARSS